MLAHRGQIVPCGGLRIFCALEAGIGGYWRGLAWIGLDLRGLEGQAMKLTAVHLGAVIHLTLMAMLAIGADRAPPKAPPKLAVATPATSTDQARLAAVSHAAADLGVFVDHRGDGAIEFKACGNKLCGRVVWVRDGAPPEACGTEIIGDASPVGDGVWDGGWILDPQIGEKFDVQVTKLSDGEVQVMGYLGSKDLSRTFLWKKASSSLKRCGMPGDVALASGG